jgi:hypothetical protein
LVSHTKGRTYIDGAREQGAENFWTYEGGNGRKMEKTA